MLNYSGLKCMYIVDSARGGVKIEYSCQKVLKLKLMNKTPVIIISAKLIVAVFITFSIAFKGDAGSLVCAIGNFLVNSNYIFGLAFIINLILLYTILFYNIVADCKSLAINV